MIGASVTRIVIYSTRKIVSVNALKAWCIGDKAPLILSLYITYRGQIHTQAALLPGGRDTGTHWIGRSAHNTVVQDWRKNNNPSVPTTYWAPVILPQDPINMRLDKPQSQYWYFGEEKNPLPVPGMEPWFLSHQYYYVIPATPKNQVLF